MEPVTHLKTILNNLYTKNSVALIQLQIYGPEHENCCVCWWDTKLTFPLQKHASWQLIHADCFWMTVRCYVLLTEGSKQWLVYLTGRGILYSFTDKVSLTHLFTCCPSGSWSCRRKATWTSWSRSGGLAPAAATSAATAAPTPTAAPSSCTASRASSASWPPACCWPAWWPGWRLGGTATAAARSSPKRWPSTGPGGRASGGKTLPHSTLRIQPQTRAPT